MEKYPNFDPVYMKFIEKVTFNQMLRLNKSSKKIHVEKIDKILI